MELIVTSTSFPQIEEDGSTVLPPPSSTIESSVREVLKSLGFPVQTNSFYMIIKQLMERIAPIMVDHQGISHSFINFLINKLFISTLCIKGYSFSSIMSLILFSAMENLTILWE
jgi:hypothetical protein